LQVELAILLHRLFQFAEADKHFTLAAKFVASNSRKDEEKFLSIHTIKFMEAINLQSWSKSTSTEDHKLSKELDERSRNCFLYMFTYVRQPFYTEAGADIKILITVRPHRQ